MTVWKPSRTPDDVLMHSAKGSTWSKHKYIRKEGNRYIYKEGTGGKEKAGTIDDLELRAPHHKYQVTLRRRKQAEKDAEVHNNLADFDDEMHEEIPGLKEGRYYSAKTQRGLAAGAKRRAEKLKEEEDELQRQRDENHEAVGKILDERKKNKERVEMYKKRKRPVKLNEDDKFYSYKHKGKGGKF